MAQVPVPAMGRCRQWSRPFILTLVLALLACGPQQAEQANDRRLLSSAETRTDDGEALQSHQRTLAQRRSPPRIYTAPTYDNMPLPPRNPQFPLFPPEPESPPPPPPPPPPLTRPPNRRPPQPPSPSPPLPPSPPGLRPPSPPPSPTPPFPPQSPSPPMGSTGPAAWQVPPSADAFRNHLWGVNGELWNPTGRLTDYSYAGYLGNVAEIPRNPATASVKDFGAVGDGVTDDTEAVIAAIAATRTGVLFFPAGRYMLSKQIIVQHSNFVMRGASRDATTLYFTKSLTDIYGQTWSGYGPEGDIENLTQSDYKAGPGLVRFAGPSSADLAGVGRPQIGVDDPVKDATRITTVVAPASRGDLVLRVAGTQGLFAGMMVTLTLSDVGGSLLNMLYGYISVPRTCTLDCVNERRVMRFHSRIWSVRSGYIVLERPLPWDVSPQFLPELHSFRPGIQLSGIEDMTIEFMHERNAGHLIEEGWNGVEFAGAANCWIRNLAFLNSDNPVIIWKSSFVTATNMSFGLTRTRGVYGCHHNVNVTWSQDVLISNFTVDQQCNHDISSFAWNNAVAIVNGTGQRINMDHHLLFPFATLWSNINVGRGDRAFLNAGEPRWGMASAALTTYYNIRANVNITSVPSMTNGPFSNFLRIMWGPPSSLPAAGVTSQQWLVDAPINPLRNVIANPVDLHAAMVATRRARFARLGRETL